MNSVNSKKKRNGRARERYVCVGGGTGWGGVEGPDLRSDCKVDEALHNRRAKIPRA